MANSSSQFDSSNSGHTTIEDVARRAGVSISTVSRALNDVGKASWPSAQRRIARIKKIAEQMNYQPNMLGQALRQGKSMTIGLIAKGMASPIAMNYISSFMALAKESGYLTYTVNIAQFGDDSAEVARVAKDLLSRRVDGLVIYRDMPVNSETYEFLKAQNVPVVFMGGGGQDNPQPQVVLDFESGINKIAHYCPVTS